MSYKRSIFCKLVGLESVKEEIKYYIHTEGENEENEQSIAAYNSGNIYKEIGTIAELQKEIETLTISL